MSYSVWYMKGTAKSTFPARCFICGVSYAQAERIVTKLLEDFGVFKAWQERE